MAVPIVIVITKDLDTSALSAIYTYQDAASGQMVECSRKRRI